MIFQSTLPREERLIVCSCDSKPYGFQSTLPREERLADGRKRSVRYGISIHAPTRGATTRFKIHCLHQQNFNPRSHERSDKTRPLLRWRNGYFNPRSHERSDDRTSFFVRQWQISIHAPTRGATAAGYDAKAVQNISIHAPTRGATLRSDGTD